MSVASQRAARIVAAALDELVGAHTSTFELMSEKCGSPIEELLLAGLMAASFRNGDVLEFREGGLLDGPEPSRPTCYQQVRIANYRVDFFIIKPTMDGIVYIVVECDGHEFHERTADQASNDRQRDRFFTSKGYAVLRFTGSEIHADPFKCGYEVIRMAVMEGSFPQSRQPESKRR